MSRIFRLAALPALALVCLCAAPQSSAQFYYGYRGGAAYNPYTGGYAAGRAGYNPYTGAYGRSVSGYNPYTGRNYSARTYYNPYTGNSFRRVSSYNSYTGRYASFGRFRRW
jgi:hypothetical protein